MYSGAGGGPRWSLCCFISKLGPWGDLLTDPLVWETKAMLRKSMPQWKKVEEHELGQGQYSKEKEREDLDICPSDPRPHNKAKVLNKGATIKEGHNKTSASLDVTSLGNTREFLSTAASFGSRGDGRSEASSQYLQLGLRHLWPQQQLSLGEWRESADTTWSPRDVCCHIRTETQKRCSVTVLEQANGAWKTQLTFIFILPLHTDQRNPSLSQWREGGRNFQIGVSCTVKSFEEVWQEPQLAVTSVLLTSDL